MKLEPVAWALYESDGYLRDVTKTPEWAAEFPKVEVGGVTVPLYAIPEGYKVVEKNKLIAAMESTRRPDDPLESIGGSSWGYGEWRDVEIVQ